MAVERLAPIITDADTSRNLRWQHDMAGNPTKLLVWKIEATSSHGLQFYAYMQSGEAFMVDGVGVYMQAMISILYGTVR